MVLAPGEDGQFAAVDVELCAGSAPAAFEDSQWLLVDRTNRRWEFWNVQDHTHDPRVGFQTVRPGECARGWVSFLIAKNAKVQKVTWDESGYGEGPYLDWMVR